jgi:hypothetical protein
MKLGQTIEISHGKWMEPYLVVGFFLDTFELKKHHIGKSKISDIRFPPTLKIKYPQPWMGFEEFQKTYGK